MWFVFNISLSSLVYLFLKWFGLSGSGIHKQFGLVFVFYKWFSSVWFGFKIKKLNRIRPLVKAEHELGKIKKHDFAQKPAPLVDSVKENSSMQ